MDKAVSDHSPRLAGTVYCSRARIKLGGCVSYRLRDQPQQHSTMLMVSFSVSNASRASDLSLQHRIRLARGLGLNYMCNLFQNYGRYNFNVRGRIESFAPGHQSDPLPNRDTPLSATPFPPSLFRMHRIARSGSLEPLIIQLSIKLTSLVDTECQGERQKA